VSRAPAPKPPSASDLARRLADVEARLARLEAGKAPRGDGRAAREPRAPSVRRCPGCGLPLRKKAGRCASCSRPLD